MIDKIRNNITFEEFDYQTLINELKDYSSPRDKITKLIKNKSIIRIKKGIYIFGDNYRKRPFSKELLGNLIYGPSYISLKFALSFHGVIPERVETITSVTSKYQRRYETPVGIFTYSKIPLKIFYLGVERIMNNNSVSFLLASKEKALSDILYLEHNFKLRSLKDLNEYLLENLRVDISILHDFDIELLDEISHEYESKRVNMLVKLLEKEYK